MKNEEIFLAAKSYLTEFITLFFFWELNQAPWDSPQHKFRIYENLKGAEIAGKMLPGSKGILGVCWMVDCKKYKTPEIEKC